MLPRAASFCVLFVGYILLEALFQQKAAYKQRQLQRAQTQIADLISRLDSVSQRIARVKKKLHATFHDDANIEVEHFTSALENAESDLLSLFLSMKRLVSSTVHEVAFNHMSTRLGKMPSNVGERIHGSNRLAQLIEDGASSSARGTQHEDLHGSEGLRALELELEDTLAQAAKLTQEFKNMHSMKQKGKQEAQEDESISWFASALLCLVSFTAGLVGAYFYVGYMHADENSETFIWLEETPGLTLEDRCAGA